MAGQPMPFCIPSGAASAMIGEQNVVSLLGHKAQRGGIDAVMVAVANWVHDVA